MLTLKKKHTHKKNQQKTTNLQQQFSVHYAVPSVELAFAVCYCGLVEAMETACTRNTSYFSILLKKSIVQRLEL